MAAEILALLTVLGALLMGAVSPGPSFVFVVRTSVAESRAAGLASAFGMGVGAFIYGTLAVLGLRTLMAEGGVVLMALKMAGGLYLVYLAYRMWRGANGPIAVQGTGAGTTNLARAFWQGLATQLSNPKIVAVFGSVFAALLPEQAPLWLYVALPPLIFIQETAWYALVALAFSANRPRAVYLNAKLWIDRAAAAFIGILGIRLVAEAVRG